MSSYQKYPSTYVKTHDGELLAGYDAIISRIRQEYEIPEGIDLGTDVDHFVNSLKENHYIICEAECNEV